MAEEHRCQTPEGHRLCVNNCGFFGSAATMNLCSKCYRDYCLKERQQQQQEASIKATLSLPSPSSSPPVAINSHQPSVPVVVLPQVRTAPAAEVFAAAGQSNRCSMCRKRVGLTGFKCRCGTTFCGSHRYPEKHNCTFDFRKVGREEIARANPLVVAEKLEKI